MSKHFLQIRDFDAPSLISLLNKANAFKNSRQNPERLAGKHILLLFAENSTRTLHSFELAAHKLGASAVRFDMASSSLQKGETLNDTVNTIAAMGYDALVLRHHDEQVFLNLEPHTMQQLALINAGSGAGAHPSQALLDLLTIEQTIAHWSTLKIAIVGDIRHSRVAKSTIEGLSLLGTRDIRLVAPAFFLPREQTVAHYDNLTAGLKDVDIIMCLRVQKERLSQDEAIDLEAYVKYFQINSTHLKLAKPNVKVMHPGPINRGIEISNAVADGPQSLILSQVRNGVYARMAILSDCLA